MRAAIDRIQSGVSDNQIGAAASAEMLAHGSEFFSIAPIVRTGCRSGVTHATSKRHSVAPGDPVLIELGGVVQRYCAPLLRTAVLGSPSNELQKLADTSLRVMDVLFSILAPGRSLDAVAQDAGRGLTSVNAAVKMRGYFGYSVGLSFPPSWVERSIEIAEGRDELLQPGMVFHAHRSMRLSGRMGVGFSETVLITKTGCESLTDFPREFFRLG